MKEIRLFITEDIVGNEKEFYDFHYVKRLGEKYKIIYDPQNPQFVMCNCNGDAYLKYDCVRIILSGESLRVDFNLVDYAIGFDFMDFGDRYMRAPLFYTIFRPHIYRWVNRAELLKKEREKFCSIVVSNGGRHRILFRTLAFHKLSEYKRVDSGGGWNNNIGRRVGSKMEFLRDYKFNLCFENASYPGYLSEKLYEAYIYGCVPIYWGDTSLRCNSSSQVMESTSLSLEDSKIIESSNMESNLQDSKVIESRTLDSKNIPFMQPQSDKVIPSEKIDMSIPKISPHLFEYKINPKAFINAHNFPNLDSLLDEVKRIDNDKNAYLEMLHQDLFLDNFEPFSYYEEKIYNFLDSIFAQDYEYAFRRGNSAMLYIYNQKAQNSYKISNFRNKIFHYPRNLIRDIRKK
ncbi:alpha-1,3-fucosyltransferase [Helicobacter saguini]|uniref:Alpha-1,3-fucosyltransferase n=1 Tax=Helicobacter saguini TaxID=1548018 RepID=A0A347VRV9_9HELI|nr:glycosyltransferase family 10 [Helicobacter saguini]MWV62757.1 alpha-1,3-fucosyltransferase [Helicobacter saguini]MWV66574.1 alpha-1,3-fucosyltransferase [Helicobacter saguini]MWV68923.1 alpha-1,3-fucosyltransferase [Helicobacter saguini]MWV71522.1 alpha-1,3-fucosyltransferase [Helicobacter saguini]TLD93620.1 alpha-1,3-fucosyltransferase [Helicobacter saguini]